jgi:putative transposase
MCAAVVLDAFSRRIVGWSMSFSQHWKIVLDDLNMAITQRCPKNAIHNSDHGS